MSLSESEALKSKQRNNLFYTGTESCKLDLVPEVNWNNVFSPVYFCGIIELVTAYLQK